MLPVPETYLHCACEINTLEGILIGNGSLNSIEEDSVRIVKADDFLPTVPNGALVSLCLSLPSGENKNLIGKVSLSGPEKMQVDAVQNLSDFERRNFFRVKTVINTLVHPVPEETADLSSAQPFQVKVTDLSISGCFIESRKKLETGSRFLLALSLSDEKMSLLCKVQRKMKSENRSNGYGCVFINNTSRQNDLLCQYLFEQQRIIIKRVREQNHFFDFDHKSEAKK